MPKAVLKSETFGFVGPLSTYFELLDQFIKQVCNSLNKMVQ